MVNPRTAYNEWRDRWHTEPQEEHTMTRCRVIRSTAKCNQPAEMHWQPFGPGFPRDMTTLGAFYRGFPAIPVCLECADHIRAGERVAFTYQGEHYEIQDHEDEGIVSWVLA